MTEKDKAVEENFPKEDANTTNTQPPTQVKKSFVSPDEAEQKKESGKVAVTMGDVLMYIGREVKAIHVEVSKICELMEKQSKSRLMPVISQQGQKTEVSIPVPVSSTPTPDAGMVKILVALDEFIKDNAIEVNGTENTMFYMVRTKKFLGAENFSKIASIVRGLNGEYVSQGKASHFKIPRGK